MEFWDDKYDTIQFDEKYLSYAKSVLKEEIPTCRYTKLACKRYLDWFFRKDLIFIPKKVDRVVNFIQRFHHFSGKSNNKRFILSDWQFWIICNIFGFYHTDDLKRRQIKFAWIEIPRKNGKSSLASVLALYMAIADGEANAEVDYLANSYKQANLSFSMSKNYLSQIDPKHKFFKFYRDSIQFPATKSFLQVLSSDASGLDGLSPYAAILDEVENYPNSDLYDVIVSGTGFRTNPLIFCILTSGLNTDSWAYEQHQVMTEILEDKKSNDEQFIAIYSLDEDDDYTDEKVWGKANPNLNITVSKDFLKTQINMGNNSPSLVNSIKVKNFNIWTNNALESWIGDKFLRDADYDVDLNDFKGQFSYIGMDLSSVGDLTALSVLIPDEDKGLFYYKNYSFLPKDNIEDNPNSYRYKEAIRNGELTGTLGNCVDYSFVLNKIMEINKICPIANLAYDQWQSADIIIKLQDNGIAVKPYSQSIGSMSKPTKEFERLMLSGKIKMKMTSFISWQFSNVVIKEDWNQNIKLVKNSYNNKIDNIIADVMALGGYYEINHYTDNSIETFNY